MKEISNSPDVITNPRYLNTPNLVSSIRATSTPRIQGLKINSPNTSPVCLSSPTIFDSSICIELAPKLRQDSPVFGSNFVKTGKVYDKKCFPLVGNLFNSPVIKSNKRPLQDRQLLENFQSKKIMLDHPLDNNDIDHCKSNCVMSNNNSILCDTNLSNMLVSQKDSLMDVDSSLVASICMETQNDTKSFLADGSGRHDEIILNSKYKIININSNFQMENNYNNCTSDSTDFKLPRIVVNSLNDSDFKLPQILSASLQHCDKPQSISSNASDFSLCQVDMASEKSQCESLMLQYPSFEINHLDQKQFSSVKYLDASLYTRKGFKLSIGNDCSIIDNFSKSIGIKYASCGPQKIGNNLNNDSNLYNQLKKSSNLNMNQIKGFNRQDEEDQENYCDDLIAFEQPSNLISDFSRPHCLPYLNNGIHRDLKAISPKIANEILNGTINNGESNIIFIDCRYPYEYTAGHLLTATNCYRFSDLLNFIKLLDLQKMQIFVFYCEFSSERAPKMLRQLRKWDRWSNACNYPNLSFPELYIIEGGYRSIFESAPDACTTPLAYIQMVDDSYNKEFRYYEALTKKKKVPTATLR